MRSRLQPNTSQQGFTLIELVVVIVILGILAVTAAPRFVDLTDDARTATLEGVAGSLESAGSLIFAKALIAGNETVDGAATTAPTVDNGGTTINISFGYPRANDAAAATALEDDILDLSAGDFVVTYYSGTEVFIEPEGVRADTATAAPTTCFVSYTEAASAGNRPTIAVTDC
jgi:MSHA pilin protein MshA